jgi:hypothetical protein
MSVCPQCLSGRLERTARQTYLEIVASCVGFYPHLCERCGRRLFCWNFTQLFSVFGAGLIGFVFLGIGTAYWKSLLRQANTRPANILTLQLYGGSEDGVPDRPVIRVPMGDTLTNESVVAMSEAGMSAKLIRNLVLSYPHSFHVDAGSLIRLKRARVDEEVIQAVIDATQTPAISPPRPQPARATLSP